MDPRDFMAGPEGPAAGEAARLRSAKELALQILGSAVKIYEKLKRGAGNPAFLTGKAWAYLASFKALARALGLRQDAFAPAVRNLEAKLAPYLLEHEPPPPKKTVLVQHKADPDKLDVERRKLSAREAREKNGAPKGDPEAFDVRGLPNERAIVIEDLTNALANGLNYPKAEARRRAEAAYRPGAPLEELISEACRLRTQ